jgi:hypothetical protein
MRIKKNENIPVTSSEKAEIVKNNPPKTPVSQKIENTSAEKPQSNETSKKPALILKSGATDLRRGAKKLGTDGRTKMGNPGDGNVRAYANKPKTTLKFVQNKPEMMSMVTMHYSNPIAWPEYQPPGQPGHTVILKGKEKDKFLTERGVKPFF